MSNRFYRYVNKSSLDKKISLEPQEVGDNRKVVFKKGLNLNGLLYVCEISKSHIGDLISLIPMNTKNGIYNMNQNYKYLSLLIPKNS